MNILTIAEIKRLAADADDEQLAALERSLEGDGRVGVAKALSAARARLAAKEAEDARLRGMYDFELRLAEEHGAHVFAGLDEVGRGPLAGPLCVGAVVLAPECFIEGLNDSKQISEKVRPSIAEQIKQKALAWSTVFVEPRIIDESGMVKSLKQAFGAALAEVEETVGHIDLALLDGNPLHFDSREVNIVKGDAQCASIAAASIIAKVARDELMEQLDAVYPHYGFAKNKGYGTSEHRDALRIYGLSDIHRVSFCSEFTQQSLF